MSVSNGIKRHCARMAVFLAALAGSTAYAAIETPEGFACHRKALSYVTSHPQSWARGARQAYVLRTMTMAQNDMIGGFHANMVIWVGTNGQGIGTTWAEIGVTRGFGGQTGLYYYSAHAVNYPTTYDERIVTPPGVAAPTPGAGHTYWAADAGGGYYATLVDNGLAWQWGPGHSPPTTEYAGGLEAYCADNPVTRVDKTEITTNQYSTAVDVWTNAENGSQTVIDADAGFVWCQQPLKWTVWIHPAPASDCPF